MGYGYITLVISSHGSKTLKLPCHATTTRRAPAEGMGHISRECPDKGGGKGYGGKRWGDRDRGDRGDRGDRDRDWGPSKMGWLTGRENWAKHFKGIF